MKNPASGATAAPADLSEFTWQLRASIPTQRAAIAANQRELGNIGTYDSATTDAKVIRTSQTGDDLVATVEQEIGLHFRGANTDAANYTREWQTRDYHFTVQNGAWKLSSPATSRGALGESLPTGTGLPDMSVIDTRAVQAPTDEEMRGSEGPAAPAPATSSLASGYNRSKAVAYAVDHVHNHNSYYVDLGDKDCTNFISQAMRDAGWTFIRKDGAADSDASIWYYDPRWYGADWSHSWSVAEKFHQFGRTHSKRLAAFTDYRKLQLGDVVQFKFKKYTEITHSAIVTRIDKTGYYISYHSNDVLNKKISDFIAQSGGYANVQYFYDSPR